MLLALLVGVWWQYTSPITPIKPFTQTKGFKWSNYFGNDECKVAQYDSVYSFSHVQGFFGYCAQYVWPLCITGSGLSSAPLCCAKGKDTAIMSSAGLWGVGHIDRRANTIEVQGGAKLSAVVRKLAEEGFALEHPPSFLEMTVAGAISTASHGSFPSGQSLSSAVVSIDLIETSRTRKELSKSSSERTFQAAKSGLGAIGFYENIVLRIVPQSRLTRLDYSLPFVDAFGSNHVVSTLLQAHSHWLTVQFSPLCDSAVIRTAKPAFEGLEISPVEKYFTKPVYTHSMRFIQPLLKLAAYLGEGSNSTLASESSASTAASTPNASPHTTSIMRGICSAMEHHVTFTDNSANAVAIPRPGNLGTWAEYYVDRSVTAEAVTAVRSALKQAHEVGKINFNGFVTVTFVSQEESTLLAPNYRYDAAAIEITTFFQGLQLNVLKIVETALEPFKPIPHLGSVHTLPSSAIKDHYGPSRIKSFSEAAKSLDRDAYLVNTWKRQNYLNTLATGFSNVKL